MHKTGSHRQRCTKIELGYADALSYIYHNVAKYKKMELLAIRDYRRLDKQDDSDYIRDKAVSDYVKENEPGVKHSAIKERIER